MIEMLRTDSARGAADALGELAVTVGREHAHGGRVHRSMVYSGA